MTDLGKDPNANRKPASPWAGKDKRDSYSVGELRHLLVRWMRMPEIAPPGISEAIMEYRKTPDTAIAQLITMMMAMDTVFNALHKDLVDIVPAIDEDQAALNKDLSLQERERIAFLLGKFHVTMRSAQNMFVTQTAELLKKNVISKHDLELLQARHDRMDAEARKKASIINAMTEAAGETKQ